MTSYFELSPQDQQDVLGKVESDLGLPQEVVEKDIWLCWALETLFRMPGALPMAFKGGTSLSKVYNVINRISEDIDISIDIRGLEQLPDGFASLSTSQVKKLRERAEAALLAHTRDQILPWLAAEASCRFGFGVVNLTLDDKGEGLRILYPSAVADPLGYLRPGMLLEFGGRNITEPFERHRVKPYAAALGLDLVFPEADVRVLSPMRTFWEKATLIHLECRKPMERAFRSSDRMSRHWSDLANLADHETGQKALQDFPLAQSVVLHKSVFFRDRDADYTACLTGGLRLLPQETRCRELEVDFGRMVEAGLFYGEKPSFRAILARLEELEGEINAWTSLRLSRP